MFLRKVLSHPTLRERYLQSTIETITECFWRVALQLYKITALPLTADNHNTHPIFWFFLFVELKLRRKSNFLFHIYNLFWLTQHFFLVGQFSFTNFMTLTIHGSGNKRFFLSPQTECFQYLLLTTSSPASDRLMSKPVGEKSGEHSGAQWSLRMLIGALR